MMNSQSLQHRVGTHCHFCGGHPHTCWHGTGKQAKPRCEDKLASLSNCKAEAEHAAQIFDGYQLRRENVRYANRIDEIEFHGHPSQGSLDIEQCASSAGVSKAYGGHGFQFVDPSISGAI